jgi:hypothetical protein
MSSEKNRRGRSLALPARKSPRPASIEKKAPITTTLISPVQNIHYGDDEDEIMDTPPSSPKLGSTDFKRLKKHITPSTQGTLIGCQEWQCTACTFLNPESILSYVMYYCQQKNKTVNVRLVVRYVPPLSPLNLPYRQRI